MINVISIYIVGILILVGISYLVVPLLLFQTGQMIENLSDHYNQISRYFGFESFTTQDLIMTKSQDLLVKIEDYFLMAGGGALSLFRNIFSGVAMVVITFVLSFYLSLQEDGVKKFLQFISPRQYEPYVLDLWQRTNRKLGKWLQAQLILGLIVGVLVFIGLTILGVPYAFVLAIIAAIFELVPMAGPIIASIPAIILGFLVSPLTGILTVVFYAFLQPFENNVIVPNVMKKAVGLNPVIIIIALLVGAELGGIIGMLLAVPVAAVIVEILGDLGEQNKDILI
ncbi:MAG: hypothetical protein US56_C0032G0003 [Candidatus Moranbacteria bacterium GW2011_GWF2_37_7]|nr:MAG: hypothetical protein US56_C0032G0003 [Candidatus Moranbacteria bacterium GW2011_GWF2_37_7]